MTSVLRALLAVLVGALALTAAPPALAATDQITWAVSPATDGAVDKRSWVELDLDPGATAEEQAAVRNLSDQTVTFRIDAADGYFTDKGRFNMLPSDQESVDAGTWITAPETVTVEPGGTGIVPFTVTVPDDAEPGDHAAGLAASLVSVGTDVGGSSVGVESRIGFRVMTRVTGDVAPAVAVENLTGDYRLSWNPFQPGSLTVTADIVNTGNVRLLLDGSATAQGASAPLVAADAAQQELLPGDRRAVTLQLDDVWPLFAVGTDLTVAPTVVTPEGLDPVDIAPLTESTTTAAVPLPQLAVLLGLALILAALLAGRTRSRRRVATLVEQAKEEGRREAAHQPS
ncbi:MULTISPECIES: WxL protein peptidoglycan domain-containing protein [unclassified Rathayibacter]|uniref:WxL protein peptidoglycan domain-containing protein n=1 Tax=unclassified Rathayibacter TaxID=2609250 RepID=UPI000F4C6763|nr:MULTISPECIES: DUF916 domain-containing protein [unclassified Rathayibacter]MCJ1702617.1 DUF916 domain-containing protein [Rathayibacter sp. VKM Ac-2926]ROP56706.1 uncharacterized protein DUF916 [Rathayibacter sp. PhB186]ROS55091.1 uncharacterized protein DUF916 [Rathayibacter sp. PhB185]TCL85800.1 uncharacterized protein DUF916 [Rathayibacter sp. PhB192]TCM31621.1 uncharacterized protein DUF916 [Rathayibacter sp. PhB179]